MDKNKKVIAILSTALVLVLCVAIYFACNNQLKQIETSQNDTEYSDESSQDDSEYSDNSYDYDDETYTEEETTRTPGAELGYYNMEEMGNALISIDGYNVSGDSDDYVWFYIGRKYDFNGDYCVVSEYDYEKGDYSETSAYEYDIASNNIIDVQDDRLDFNIEDRKTTSKRPNFVCFVSSSYVDYFYWYVPYSLIDWDRGFEKATREDENGKEKDIVKLYLDPSV